MENFQDRGVWIRIRSLKNAWIRIRFVLRGWIRSISDRIRNPGADDRISRVIFLAEWNESSRRIFIPCRTLALQLICVEQRTYIAIRNNLKPILTMILYTIQTKYSHLISIELYVRKSWYSLGESIRDLKSGLHPGMVVKDKVENKIPAQSFHNCVIR